MTKKLNPTTAETPESRLRTLEGKAQTLELWLKVVFGIAAALGISGGYLFQRAQELKTSYDALTGKQHDLESQLDTDLRTKAATILQSEAPGVLKAEIAKLVSTQELQTKIDSVNKRISGITLVQGPEQNHVFNCQQESRPFEQYPGKILVMIGQRNCSQPGATYFKLLDLSIPPPN